MAINSCADRVAAGMDVYDAKGDKVGTVDEVYDASDAGRSSSGGGYLRVPTGFLGLAGSITSPSARSATLRPTRST